jgi:hypothetical protein
MFYAILWSFYMVLSVQATGENPAVRSNISLNGAVVVCMKHP